MFAPMTDAELTEAVPLVVDGLIIAKRSMRYIDDPELPAGWESDPEAAAVVNSGGRHTRWTVEVTAFIKGSTPSPLFLSTGEVGDGSGTGCVAIDATELTVGGTYRFWLSPGTWYGENTWVGESASAL